MYSKELIDFCEKYKDFTINEILKKEANTSKIVFARLLEETSFLILDKPYIKLRLNAVNNNLTNHPTCKLCNNPAHVHKSHRYKFAEYCSQKCRATGNVIDRDIFDLEHIKECRDKRMSLAAIGKLYGCSENIIKEVMLENNIPFHNLTKAYPHVIDDLSSYDKMYDMYVTQNMTCEAIAEEIGSSKAVVSIWINDHNIPITPPNAYDKTFHRRSKKEIELCDIITKWNTNTTYCNRTVLDGKELDIYVGDKNFAIEFNGTLYHSEIYGKKDKDFHTGKTQGCLDKGVELWHIFEDQWDNKTKRDIWLSRIKSRLGISDTRIFGRKCVVSDITLEDKQLFLNTNHLQGTDKATHRYGLHYEGELVAVMTFCKSRYNKKCNWELSRYAVKKYHSVIGGFSKLLSHFRKHNTGSIVSYADKTYSMGNVYEKNGFTLEAETKHDYFYIKNGVRYGKHGFTKEGIKNKCEFYDGSLTEWQNMILNGYDKIHTCGMKTYVLH